MGDNLKKWLLFSTDSLINTRCFQLITYMSVIKCVGMRCDKRVFIKREIARLNRLTLTDEDILSDSKNL